MPKPDKSPLFSIEPGTMLAGKYRAVRTLATGGMGTVVLVKHEVLGQKAAIKVLRPEALASRDAAERFLREARASANLKSDHVVRVFDVGSLDDGSPFMLMEYLEGRDLAEEVRRRGRLPPSEAVDYVLQAIDAVAEAHAIGVIHRDLKPSNLFVVTRADGVRLVKVLDFGISKVIAGVGEISDGAVTTADALLGSPAYMSPEQVKSSKDVDGRTDVWSLGVVLYELITGARAFEGDTVGSILSQILCEDVTPISKVIPDLPRGLDAVVARCLERDREARFESVLALRDALMPFASERARRTLPSRASMPPPAPELVQPRVPKGAVAEAETLDISTEKAGVQTTVAVSSERRSADPEVPLLPLPIETHARSGARPALIVSAIVIAFAGVSIALSLSRGREPETQPRPAAGSAYTAAMSASVAPSIAITVTMGPQAAPNPDALRAPVTPSATLAVSAEPPLPIGSASAPVPTASPRASSAPPKHPLPLPKKKPAVDLDVRN